MGTFSTPTFLILCSTIVAVNAACWYTFENADCSGHDLSHSHLNRAACRAACTRRTDCKSFQQRGNDCWLKDHVCTKKQLSNVGHKTFAQFTKHCGACSYSFENADCSGHDLSHSHLNRAACRAACTRGTDCKSFQQRGNDCWLKDHVCTKTQLSNVGHKAFAQFTKHCGGSPSTEHTGCSYSFENADCSGHDLSHSHLNRAACQAACTRRTDCKSFQQRGNDCWLKDHVCTKKQLSNVGHKTFAQFTKHCGVGAIATVRFVCFADKF
ncbi:uncharacterized protein LOC135494365 [Lineus longissimus]|uniref:uncharacterized protein LOC135494365 n=1 Tax=Lineus longissimus TaxID=88925 RepID=UPI00315D8155